MSDKISRELPEYGKVPTKNLFAYATGLAGQNMTYGYISGWLFYYLEYIMGIKAVTVGIITSIARAWDSINDPLIGAMVDKHKFKNGEKLRPIIIYCAPIIGILSALMFFPIGNSPTAKIIIVTVEYLLWDIAYSFQDVGLWGMVAMSSPSSDERRRVSQWVSIGSGAGSTIATFFQTFRSVASGSFGLSDISVFALFGIIFGFGGEMLSMTAYKMKEEVEVPASEESILEAIFVLRHNKTLLLISLARFFKDVFASLLPAVYFFESKQIFNFGFFKLSGGNTQVAFNIFTGMVGAITMFFTNNFARKVGGMKKILQIAQSTNAIVRLIAYFIGIDTVPGIFSVMGLLTIANIPCNMMDIAHRSLTSDSIDEVEYKTGKRTEGISFSVQNFISKLTSAVGLLVNGIILGKLKHDSSLPNHLQNTTYMKWQWPIYMLGPVIGSVLYTSVISFVSDDKEKRTIIEAELRERRQLAEEKETAVNAD